MEPHHQATEATEQALSTPEPSRGDHVGKAQAVLDMENEKYDYRARIERARRLTLHRKLMPAKRLPGASVKYTEDMPDRVEAMLTEIDVIFTKKLVAAHLGVDESTFRAWRDIYPELAAAVARGLAAQEAWLATLMADGMKYSASLYAVLKNLHDWRDKVDETHTFDFREAMKKQALSAKRVNWDRPSVIDVPGHAQTPAPQPAQSVLQASSQPASSQSQEQAHNDKDPPSSTHEASVQSAGEQTQTPT